MKHLMIAAIFGMAAFTATSQNNAVENYFSDYEALESFTKVNVTAKMFELAVHIEGADEEEQELLDAVSKIEGLTVLAKDEAEDAASLYKNALERPGSEFEELMTVEDEEAEVTFLIKEKRGVISELLLIFGTTTEFGVVNMWGEIDLKHLRKMTETFQVQGMKFFDNDLAEAGRAVKLYPNPVSSGDNATLEVSETLKGGTLEVFDINGKQVLSEVIGNTTSEVRLSGLNSGSYVLKITVDNAKVYSEKIIISQ
jgi:hypothetical protein